MAILEILGGLIKIIADWPKRKADAAAKSYANWRAQIDLKKERRKLTVGELIKSTDSLLRKKGKLPRK